MKTIPGSEIQKGIAHAKQYLKQQFESGVPIISRLGLSSMLKEAGFEAFAPSVTSALFEDGTLIRIPIEEQDPRGMFARSGGRLLSSERLRISVKACNGIPDVSADRPGKKPKRATVGETDQSSGNLDARPLESPKLKGVSLLDAALICSEFDHDAARDTKRRWERSRNPKLPRPIGRSASHKQRHLFNIKQLANFIEEVEANKLPADRLRALGEKLQDAIPVRYKPSAPSAKLKTRKKVSPSKF